jgi:hypothetical protein
MGEALQGDAVAVVDELPDSFGQPDHLGHGIPS